MKSLTKVVAALAVATLIVPAAAIAADKPVELSVTELATVQSKVYVVPAKTLFGATVATLQTLGYVDINASKDAGTITGTTEAKAKTIYNIFWGFGKKKLTQKASLLVEENGAAGAMVRLNLHINEAKARGIWGTSFSDGKLVRVAEPYTSFFTALDGEVRRRAVPVAPASPAASPPVAATAAESTPSAAPAAEPTPNN